LEKAVTTRRPPVIWLNFASDTGCTEALLKAHYPDPAQLILETLSMDYNETIMAAAGDQAEEILHDALKRGEYILIIEGGVPMRLRHRRSWDWLLTRREFRCRMR
jgi:Ni,Fe-hydrogenase I small subunit